MVSPRLRFHIEAKQFNILMRKRRQHSRYLRTWAKIQNNHAHTDDNTLYKHEI